jgi:hypothetical protein
MGKVNLAVHGDSAPSAHCNQLERRRATADCYSNATQDKGSHKEQTKELCDFRTADGWTHSALQQCSKRSHDSVSAMLLYSKKDASAASSQH